MADILEQSTLKYMILYILRNIALHIFGHKMVQKCISRAWVKESFCTNIFLMYALYLGRSLKTTLFIQI